MEILNGLWTKLDDFKRIFFCTGGKSCNYDAQDSRPVTHFVVITFFGMKQIGRLFVMVVLLLVPLNAHGMEFSWKDFSILKNHTLTMEGEIVAGDAEKFRRFLQKDFAKYREYHNIEITSNGGNLIEALQIASQLKAIYPSISVTGDCASACFFIYLSGVSRIVRPGGRLGIHRPYFDPKYFAGLSLQKARDQQTLLTKSITLIMEENEIPKDLTELMKRTASSEVYWLTPAQVRAIKSRPSWFEEVLIARCDYAKYRELSDRFWKESKSEAELKQVGDLYWESLGKLTQCERRIIGLELTKYAADLASGHKNPSVRR